MNPLTFVCRELDLDELEAQRANDPAPRFDATLLLLLAASVAVTGLVIVGGVTVTQHIMAWF